MTISVPDDAPRNGIRFLPVDAGGGSEHPAHRGITLPIPARLACRLGAPSPPDP
ncbi:hypothetical protein [Methylobacterium soli]|uniref:hypothetical protein n=1 Tax=Methylobacterium soli TaxID=553447 RepID=UPI001783B983|nr:hypothetical protein [Methylobacterium soli]